MRRNSGTPKGSAEKGRQVFDAQKPVQLLPEIPTLVGPTVMQNAMGATKSELAALTKEGLRMPRTNVAEVKSHGGSWMGRSLLQNSQKWLFRSRKMPPIGKPYSLPGTGRT